MCFCEGRVCGLVFVSRLCVIVVVYLVGLFVWLACCVLAMWVRGV